MGRMGMYGLGRYVWVGWICMDKVGMYGWGGYVW